jgi:hydroxypyruvate isomerase
MKTPCSKRPERAKRIVDNLKFDLNVSITLPHLPFLQRFDAARDLGFEAVEFWWPGDQDLAAVERAVSRSGLQVALVNLDGGDLSKGERGLMNAPAYAERFRRNVPIALDFASALGCGQLNALAGNLLPGEPLERQLERISQSLAWAASMAAERGTTLLLEALNSTDTPLYPLTTTEQSMSLADRCGAPNVKLQYDVYHMWLMGEDPLSCIAEYRARIGHIQVADDAGRHEPGCGWVPFRAIFGVTEACGYDGWIGLEYTPSVGPSCGFDWLPRRRGDVRASDLCLPR